MSVCTTQVMAVYLECVRNRASDFNLHVTDGCVSYTPGDDMACAACGCNQHYHRRVVVNLPAPGVIDKLRGGQIEISQNTSAAREASPEPQISATNRFQLSPVLSANREEAVVPPVVRGAVPARRRTRISAQQIVMLREVIGRNEFKMFREYSREEIEEICSRIGIERVTLKNWIYRVRRQERN